MAGKRRIRETGSGEQSYSSLNKPVKVFFIILVFLFSGCSLSDYLDPVSSWFDEDQEVTHSVVPPTKREKKPTKKLRMDSEAQKIIQRYFKTHETGIYVHIDSIKRKVQKRKKKKNSQESEFAPPIAAPVAKVTRQNLP